MRKEQIVSIPEKDAVFQDASRGIDPHQLELEICISEFSGEKLIYRGVVFDAANIYEISAINEMLRTIVPVFVISSIPYASRVEDAIGRTPK